MATADMRGHNSRSYGEDEPRSLTKEEKLRFLNEAHLAAKLLAAVALITKKEVLGKRQGVRGYVLRCILEDYLISRACPKKYIAKIIGVARDVPGDDERRMWGWRDNEKIDADIHMIHGFIDRGLDISDDIDAIIARCAGEKPPPEPEEEEVELPPPPPPKPVKKAPYVPGVDPKPDDLRRRKEAESLTAKKNFNARDEYLTGRILACKKLIILGGKKGATKDAKENAGIALRDLEKHMKERQALRKAWKAANAA